jgi:hypothetical protein
MFGGISSNEQAVDELYILTLPSFQWTLVCVSLHHSSPNSNSLYTDMFRSTQHLFQITSEVKPGCLAM